MAYKSNRNRHRQQPQSLNKEPTQKQVLEGISYRQGVQERMLLRILRYLRLQGSALEDLTDIGVENMFDVTRLVAAATKQTDAVKAMKDAMDKMLKDLRDAQDDPVQLEAALAAFEANTVTIETAANASPESEPPPVIVTPGSQGGGDNQS